MKTNIKASIFCVTVFMLVAQFAYAELPDLTVFGFKTNKFHPADSVLDQIPITIYDKYSTIEEDDSIIDTSEEFYTAYYYSPVKIEAVEAIIPKTDKRFPLELCMLWQRKLVMVPFMGLSATEANTRTQNYNKILKTIMEREGLTTAEVSSYFKANIAKDVESTFIEAFGFCSVKVSKKYTLDIQRTADNKYDINILTMEANQLKETVITISNMSELSQYGFTSAEITEIQNNLDFSFQHMYKETVEKLCQIVADFFIEPSQRNYQRLLDLFSHIETYMVINPSYAKYRVNIYELLVSFNVAFVLKLEENATARIKSGKLKTETTLTASELKTLLVPAFGGDLRGTPLYNPNSRIFK